MDEPVIAIDARWIFPEISGIGAYTRDLIRALGTLDRHSRYLLLFDNAAVMERTLQETGLCAAANVAPRMLDYGVFSPAGQWRLPHVLRRERVDVYHSPNYMIPLMAFPRDRPGRTACLTTIHDVIPMIFRDHAPRSRKARVYPLYRRVMLEVGRRSDLIATDSQSSRRDIIRHLAIAEARHDDVRVVPCGVSERFAPRTARPPHDPGRPRSLLYVGRADPYKNICLLVRAFAAVRARAPFPVSLTVAGSPDPRYPDAQRLAEQLGLGDAMNWTGYLSDDELARVYREADLLVHPSRYEGFGLQVVEAMASGVPVICSNAGSLPEVAGEAAVLLDPDDEDGFAREMLDVLTHSDRAAHMVNMGLAQAARFTWQRTARETLALYLELAAHRSRTRTSRE